MSVITAKWILKTPFELKKKNITTLKIKQMKETLGYLVASYRIIICSNVFDIKYIEQSGMPE